MRKESCLALAGVLAAGCSARILDAGSTPDAAIDTMGTTSSAGSGQASSGSFIGSGSAASAQSYSQDGIQPLVDDAGFFPQITCYGTIDGSSCLISDINGGGSTLAPPGTRSVECSAATATTFDSRWVPTQRP